MGPEPQSLAQESSTLAGPDASRAEHRFIFRWSQSRLLTLTCSILSVSLAAPGGGPTGGALWTWTGLLPPTNEKLRRCASRCRRRPQSTRNRHVEIRTEHLPPPPPTGEPHLLPVWVETTRSLSQTPVWSFICCSFHRRRPSS